jgi:hypothetical protein
MKSHELRSVKSLFKAALEGVFPSSSFEIMINPIERDYHIRRFKQMTLDDYSGRDDDALPELVGAHYVITIHPQALREKIVKKTFKKIITRIKEDY